MASISPGRKIHSAAAFLLVLLWPALALSATRSPEPVDESDAVTLYGNTPRWAAPQFDLGPIAPEMRLNRIVLQLKIDPHRERALELLLQAQHQPASQLFHHWLSPVEFGRRFGVPDQQLARVTGWLASHGFQVEPVPSGRRMIVFSGTEGAVEEAFHVQVHRYTVGGQVHLANSQDPQIPRALSGVVEGILSLHDLPRQSQIAREIPLGGPPAAGSGNTGRASPLPPPRLHPLYTQGTTHYLFPADFATIYDLNPLYSAGISGAGASIAIVGRSNIVPADVAEFRGYANLPGGPAPTVILDGPDPGLVPGDQDEATLDIEWSGAVAPAATVNYVAAASTSATDGVDLAAAYVVNNLTSLVMSTSFATCESQMGATELAFYNSLWMQAASEGISAFVAAGDSGAAGCSAGSASSGGGQAVNGMCSSPWATCVGGTEFNEGDNTYWNPTDGPGNSSALGYIPEVVWNESGTNGGSQLWASGGGVSTVYPQPPWQVGVPGANSNGMRAVPDVALTAAEHDGYLACLNASWYVFSGTSAASPTFAAILALVTERQNGIGQGSANPGLYAMLTAPIDPFHTTLGGNNSVPGVNGYSASGTLYNLATGLGSVDALELVDNWVFNPAGIAESFTLKPSVSTLTLVVGRSATFTIAAGSTSGYTGPIALSGTAPAGITLSFQPATITPGQSATVTVTASTNSASGTGSITIVGVGGSAKQTVSVALTLQPAPALSLTASASALTVLQGGSTSVVLTIATGGVYSGPVTLSVTGLPGGVIATWSQSTITPPANTAASSAVTLTLSAATSAPVVSNAPLRILASGDNLQAIATPTLTVATPASASLSLSAPSSAFSLVAGASTVIPVIVHTAKNVSGLMTVGVSGLPAGVVATWSTTRFELPASSAAASTPLTLTLQAIPTAPLTASPIPLTLVVFGDGLEASFPATLAVIQPASIQLALSTNTASLTTNSATGGALNLTATLRLLGSIALAANLSDIHLSVRGLPAGVTANWGAVTLDAAGQPEATLALAANPTAQPGNFRLLLLSSVTDAVSGADYYAMQPVALAVHPANSLAITLPAADTSLQCVPGSAAQVPVQITSQAPLLDPVRLTVFGLPSGVTASWTSDPLTLSGGVGATTLMLQVDPSARPYRGAIRIAAAADGLAAAQSISLHIY